MFAEFKPTHVMHLAAESHVDRSIDGPAVNREELGGEFNQTINLKTVTLFEALSV